MEIKSLKQQLQSFRALTIISYAVTLFALFFTLYIAQASKIPMSVFTRDTIAVADVPPYYGILSNLGVLIWGAAGSICFFSFYILKEMGNSKYNSFLLLGVFISYLLLFDDFFTLHELGSNFLYRYYPMNHEYTIFGGYGLLVLFYLWYHKALILKSDFVFLFVALCFFALSIIVDHGYETLFSSEYNDIRYLVEDGSKFLGIVNWTIYQIRTIANFFKA
jgi:hypothetical protein